MLKSFVLETTFAPYVTIGNIFAYEKTDKCHYIMKETHFCRKEAYSGLQEAYAFMQEAYAGMKESY
jgi:hypothetical protein